MWEFHMDMEMEWKWIENETNFGGIHGNGIDLDWNETDHILFSS